MAESTKQARQDTTEGPSAEGAVIKATIAKTSLQVVQEGPERIHLLIDMIDAAQRNVRMLFYMFSADEAGEAVRDALVRAVERGCEVRLIIDKFGSGDASAEFFQPIHDAGGHYCLFHPSYGRRYLLRNHQKLVVIDDTKGIIGGANVNTAYFSCDETSCWRDLWLSMEGQEVEAAARYFDSVRTWTTTKGSKLSRLRAILREHTQNEGALQWHFSGPGIRHASWRMQIAKEIIAGKRLEMISAYFSPPFAMLRRLSRMGRRGEVRIVTAAKSDNQATIAAARFTYRRLLRNRVRMFEYQRCKLHTKLVIIDDVVHIGSSNFDFRSLYLNLEIMLRIDDAEFAAAMRAYFERELASCVEITPALHKARATFFRRIKWAFSNFLVTTIDYTVTRRLNFGTER